MKFLKKVFQPKLVEIDIPEPDKYPGFHNVADWMEQKVDYFAKKKPKSLYKLFCPSMADYLPLTIDCGTGPKLFLENIELYRDLKKKYPEAVREAQKHRTDYSMYRGGPYEDYVDKYDK